MIPATTLALYAMAAALAVLVGRDLFKFFVKEDSKIVARRKNAIALAQKLTAAGLKILPNMLNEYGTGDYIGLGEEIEKQVVLFLGPGGNAAVVNELEATFESVLAAKLADPAGLAYIQAKIAALPTSTSTSAASK